MKRRSFFRSLALMAGAASVSPTIFIPKFEPVRWKRTIGTVPYDWNALQIRCSELFGKWQFIVYEKEPTAVYVLPIQTQTHPVANNQAAREQIAHG